MNVLIVNNTYPLVNNVSSFRIKSFVKSFQSCNIQTDIMVFCDVEEVEKKDNIIYFPDEYVFSFGATFKNYNRIRKIISRHVGMYDYIILSLPKMQLALLTSMLKKKGKVITDLRDHPELIYFQNKQESKFYMIPILLIQKYIVEYIVYSNIKKSDFTLCVGEISKTKLLKIIGSRYANRVINVHNGYEIEDLELDFKSHVFEKSDSVIRIGMVGNLYNFRHSKDFLVFIKELNNIQKPVELNHFGKPDTLFVKDLRLLEKDYKPQGNLDRKELLQVLNTYDLLVLVTSQTMEWEPTTSVFDYLLTNKPIIFLGNKNNEAHRILIKNKCRIIYSTNILQYTSEIREYTGTNTVLIEYSREKQNENLLSIINENQ